MDLSFRQSGMRTALLLLGVLNLSSSRSLAQDPFASDSSTLSFWSLTLPSGNYNPAPSALSQSRAPRLRLFRMMPGFLADPLGMQEEDCELPGVQTMPGPNQGAMASAAAGGLEFVQFGMGWDNPYLDLRRPGDPGGVGYYRVNTQVALFDTARTACTFGVQAVTPGGIQFAGMPDGPTVFSPAFSVFHALNDRVAVQGFLSKNVLLNNNSALDANYTLQRNLQYGMALQRPLLADGPDGWRSLYFSVGALGQLRSERDGLGLVSNYDVLPGLQWHVNDNWWMSSALLMPLGPVHAAPGQWQLTCSLQF